MMYSCASLNGTPESTDTRFLAFRLASCPPRRSRDTQYPPWHSSSFRLDVGLAAGGGILGRFGSRSLGSGGGMAAAAVLAADVDVSAVLEADVSSSAKRERKSLGG
jgi:hypothetical protein